MTEIEKIKNTVYRDLAPVNNIAPEEESIQALQWAISNPNIHNVALSGPYGSGKSSVIKSYLAQYDAPGIKKANFLNHNLKKSLQISLATFDGNKMKDDKLKEELQRGILKQLFYKVDASRIPLSRYRKLHHIKGYKYVLLIILSILLMIAGVYLMFPQKIDLFWNQYWQDVGRVDRLCRIGTAGFFIGGISYVLWLITSRFRIKSIGVGDVVAEEKDIERESILDQNIDEILYFFEKTKYRVVFIEDLDRFDNTEIFVNLRELNEILNEYEVLKKRGKITFVYAVRDDLFSKETDRTKFFDFIIPVIPVINSTNSDEVMKNLLDIGKGCEGNRDEVTHEISENFIKQVYPFIGNMRTLTNIVNEFWFYKRILKTDLADKLDDEKIMALMIYKNLYPKDFAELEDERGTVKSAFEQKEELIKKQSDKLKEKKADILNIIKDAPNSVREIKQLILDEFCKGIPKEGHSFSYIVNLNGEVVYDKDQILQDDFSMDVFRQNKMKVSYLYYNSYKDCTDWSTVNSNSELKSLFDRYDQYRKFEISSTEEAKKEIEETEKKLQELRSNTLQQLLEDRQFEQEMPENVKCNKLLLFLLRKGYINENYADYINYFREGAISREELNFIRTIRNNQGECNFEFVVNHHANVIGKLFDYEFEQVELLNYSLTDYLLQSNIGSSQLKILIKQVTNRSEASREFIKGYFEFGQCVSEFVKQITNASKYIWEDILEDTVVTEERKLFFLNLILAHAPMEAIENNNLKLSDDKRGNIAQYICSRPDIFIATSCIKVEKWVQIIIQLEINFYEVNLQGVDRKIIDVIITYCRYQLNRYMLREIVSVLAPEYLSDLFIKNYYCLRMLNRSEILEYVDRCIDEYVEKIIIGEPTNTGESTEDVEKILKALIDKEHEASQLCVAVLEKEQKVHWDTFAQFLPQQSNTIHLWGDLLRYNRITADWKNCITYYESVGEFDYTLCEYIDYNIDEILGNQRNDQNEYEDSFKLSHQFLQALLLSNIRYNTFEKIISLNSIDTLDCSCDNFELNKLELMIQRNYIPFGVDKLNEIKEISADLWLIYIENNQVDFLDNISEVLLDLEDVKKLLRTDLFVEKEIMYILNEIDESMMDEELAEVLFRLSGQVHFEKNYVEATWNNLPDNERYKWLYDQMQVYNLDELAEHFAQLENTYHQFVQRTLHKYKVHNNDYNAMLCEKLKKRGFLTSVNYKGEWIEGFVKRKE